MSMTDAAGEQEIRRYLAVLRRRKWIVAFAMLMIAGTATAISLVQSPMYAATAKILLRPSPREGALLEQRSEREISRAIPTEIELVRSKPVRDRVRGELGVAPEVTVKQVGNTEFMEIRSEHRKPGAATRIANTYASEYIDYRRDQAVEALLAVSERLSAQVGADQAQVAALTAQLAAVRPGEPLTPDQQRALSQRETLLRRIATNEESLSETQARAETASGAAQLVTPAERPTEPFKPTPVRSGVIAGIIGLCFGLGLAFLVDFLDDSVKSLDDLSATTGALPVIGVIPLVGGWKDRERPVLVTLDDSTSAAAEAYRTVRTSVQFLELDRPLKTIQVTSPGAGDGKTATVVNLAVAMASSGKRVLVVDCDLRRPRTHKFLGATNKFGFTSVLLGEVSLGAAVRPVSDVRGLYLLASGPPPPNPSELLGSVRAGEVFTALKSEFDAVIIDCPPVLPVTDAVALSSRVDATLVVATANVTPRKALSRAVEMLRQVGAPLAGVVLNGVPVTDDSYGYGYGYSQEALPVPKRGDAVSPAELVARNTFAGAGVEKLPRLAATAGEHAARPAWWVVAAQLLLGWLRGRPRQRRGAKPK